MSHTPGPWQVEYDDLTEEWVVHWPDGYAAVNGLMNGHQAQMIAAAPEMFDAIVLAKDLLEQGNIRTAMTVLNEVAVKAKGEAK